LHKKANRFFFAWPKNDTRFIKEAALFAISKGKTDKALGKMEEKEIATKLIRDIRFFMELEELMEEAELGEFVNEVMKRGKATGERQNNGRIKIID
jgi:hypothetical protein